MANSPADHTTGAQTSEVQAAQGQTDAAGAPPEFAPTQIDENASDWWSESTDGQCSENAALFAASQPAPLSIV